MHELLLRLGYHEAIIAFQEAVKLDPEYIPARAWMRAVYLAPELVECVPEKLLLKVKRGISRVE
jgi:hypothetical protein